MSGRAKAVRWAVIACQALAVPAIALALILHFDTSLAHRLSEMSVGAVTVSAVLSCIAVVSSTWSNIASAINFLRKRQKDPYKPPENPVSRRIEVAATELAASLRQYAEDEITARGLKDPAPLPVRWRRVITRPGTMGNLRPAGGEHSDKIETIIDLLRESARRFVLIGPPGSGKTAVTLFFQRDLIGTGPESPVPFTLSLSTWNPPTPLADWAAARLEERYPQFAAPVAQGSGESVAQRLIRGNRVRLILDAMDELPADLLSQVFGELNQLGPEFPVIVTCRTADYLKARQSASGQGQAWELGDALVFELLPPSTNEIRNYLGAAMDPAPWNPVFEYLNVDGPLARALTTPLMVWLTRRVYHRQPGLLAKRLEEGWFPGASALENHLLDNLVEVVYGRKDSREERHLRFLARHVTARANSRYQFPSGRDLITLTDNGQDIAWWRLVHDRRTRLADWILLVLIGGLAPGGALGLGWASATWNWLGHPAALLSGIGLGAVSAAVMTAGCMRNNPPPAGTRFTRPGPVRAPAVVLCFALVVGGAASMAMAGNLTSACFALIIAMPVALAYTFTNPYVDPRRVETPRRHYRADVQQSFVYFAAYALGIGTYTALFRPWPLALVLAVLTGVAGGFTYGAGYKLAYGRNMPSGMVAFLRFRVAHARLALTGRLPWSFFAFLEQAHKHGVLRRSGASYQFSHIRLRDRLVLEPSTASPK